MAVRSISLVALVALAIGCAATLDENRVCTSGSCDDGQACVVGRCRPSDVAPAPADAQRIIVEPIAVAVAASGARGGGGADLPDAVALGRASSGTVEVFLRFAAPWRDEAEVTSAFLVLTPIEASTVATKPISIEVARVVETWRPATLSWGRQPRLDAPLLAKVAMVRSNAPLRVDVTELVRAWSKRDRADRGLALIAKGDDAFGVAFALGVGAGPRLEAYVR